MKIPMFWPIFFGLIVVVIIGSLVAGEHNAEGTSAVHAQYEREISTTFDGLPLPPETKVTEQKRQEGYRPPKSPSGSGFIVRASYERPGTFADTLKAFRSELRNQGWVETYNDRGSRISFCKAPYRLELAESGLVDEKIHGFQVALVWPKRQMEEDCR
jgi:hypothetical protein